MLPVQRMFNELEIKNINTSELCKFLGVANSTVSGWKLRNSTLPDKYILPICEFLGLSPEYLLSGKDSKLELDDDNVLLITTLQEKQLIQNFRYLSNTQKELFVQLFNSITN